MTVRSYSSPPAFKQALEQRVMFDAGQTAVTLLDRALHSPPGSMSKVVPNEFARKIYEGQKDVVALVCLLVSFGRHICLLRDTPDLMADNVIHHTVCHPEIPEMCSAPSRDCGRVFLGAGRECREGAVNHLSAFVVVERQIVANCRVRDWRGALADARSVSSPSP